MKFRFDINALRAIAVLSVILFHYKVPFVQGGFAGVDIFFVISGYLMTRITVEGLSKNTFSLMDFYSKRVKRIIPALLVLVTVVVFAGLFIYMPSDYQILSKNAASSVLFISNIVYWKNSNYFDPEADTNVFLHTWSLSVEWQFYLIFPLVLMICRKLIYKERLFKLIFLLTTVALFIFSILVTSKAPTSSFYLLPTRSWEMMLGGIAFLYQKKVPVSRWLAIGGYAVIFISLFLIHNGMAWPGMYTLFPVAGTFMVIIANYNEFKILQQNVVQYLGKISYSLYLWHWPIVVFATYLGFTITPLSIIVMILASIALAVLSYHYIESINFQRPAPILFFTLTVAIITGTFMKIYVNEGMFKEDTLRLAQYARDHKNEIKEQFSTGKCFISSQHTGLKDYSITECLIIDSTKNNILLLGDSHAAALSASFRKAFAGRNLNLLQATASGCLPVVDVDGEARCTEVINFIFKTFIPANKTKIDGIVISANWINVPIKERNELIENLDRTLEYFKSYKIKTIVIGQNETYVIPYSTIAAKSFENNKNVSPNYLDKESFIINQILKDRFKDHYVDIINYNTPELNKDFTPYMFDNNHFSEYGADLTIAKILINPLSKTIFEN